ncbi:MAG: DUF2933 domain-containing protein [Paralcaligenes sp.]
MQCDTKTMIKVGLGLGMVVAGAYVLVPAARVLITAAAPFLFFLLCPISMIFMMKSMNSNSSRTGREVDAPNVKTPTRPEATKSESP